MFCSSLTSMEVYNIINLLNPYTQRWSRGHNARGQGQGHKKILRPRTDPLEAKAKDQGHRRKCFPKKKVLKFFSVDLKKNKIFQIFFRRKRSSKIFFRRSLLEETKKRSLQIFRKVSGVFQRNFNDSKIVLSSSRGQGNFRGFEASRPRPRTSKCVLEDSISANRSCGFDGVDVNYLRTAAVVIAPVLALLCNSCLTLGIPPASLKISKVIPISKAGDKTNVTDYCPISLQSCFSAILENLAYTRFIDFLNHENALLPTLYRFRRNLVYFS